MTSTASLTGITSESGECDRCGRELGRIYEVRHPDGTTGTYGRKCCAVVTGYKANRIEALAAQAARIAAAEATRAYRYEIITAEFPQAPAPGEWPTQTVTDECVGNDSLWNGRGTPRWADWRAMMREAA
jgi:hypothetical protein